MCLIPKLIHSLSGFIVGNAYAFLLYVVSDSPGFDHGAQIDSSQIKNLPNFTKREDNSVLSIFKGKSPHISRIILKIAAFFFFFLKETETFVLLLLKR